MVYVGRTARRWLDSVSVGRFAGLIAVAMVLLFAATAADAATYATQYEAYSACVPVAQSYQSQLIPGGAVQPGVIYYSCQVVAPKTYWVVSTVPNSSGKLGDDFTWTTDGGFPNPCGSIKPTSMFMDGKVLDGTTFTENATDAGGNTVACTMTFAPSGRPIWNPYSNTWQTAGTASPTGNPSTSGGSSGSGDWIGPDGGPMQPQPTNDPASGSNAPPQVCDGGSCYDPSTDQYCSVSGGVQSCVSGSTASGSPGGCTNTPSGGAICGGAPTAPLPNVPTIDPATDISSTDTYTTANPVTGATTTTVINNYVTNGTTSSSGQGSTDSGPTNGGQSQGGSPAHASSSGGNGTLSGGTNCDTPPVCTGDSVLCGIARTDWSATCQVHKDMAGDGTGAAAMASAVSANPPSSAWVASSSSGNTTADNANSGIYDGSGFGYGTQCPMQDLTVPLPGGSFVVPFSKGCVIGPWIAGVIKAFALFSALLITMGKRS